jgi:hypothetical protein
LQGMTPCSENHHQYREGYGCANLSSAHLH